MNNKILVALSKTAKSILKRNMDDNLEKFNDFGWTSWDEPPIRAIIQKNAYARDLSIFLNLLEMSLKKDYQEATFQICFKPIFPMEMFINYPWDYLWFNPVPLGNAISHICKGLRGLKEIDNDCLRKIIIEYGCKVLNPNKHNYFFYFKIYEYLSLAKPEKSNNVQYTFPYIKYNKSCWTNPNNDMKHVWKYLYICGFKTLIYSGYENHSFKSDLITLNSTNSVTSEDLNISHYRNYPPFIFFGLPFQCSASNIQAKEVKPINKSVKITHQKLFGRDYEEKKRN